MNTTEKQRIALQIGEWRDLSSIDHDALVKVRFDAIQEALTEILAKDPSPILRVVVEATQHGTMSIHAETIESHKNFVARFRKDCNWHHKFTDAELYEKIGPWHFEAFGYSCAEFLSQTYSGDLMDAEYGLWERLDQRNQGMACYHNASAVEAIVSLEESKAYAYMKKAAEFELKFFDGNSVGWEANDWLIQKRKN